MVRLIDFITDADLRAALGGGAPAAAGAPAGGSGDESDSSEDGGEDWVTVAEPSRTPSPW